MLIAFPIPKRVRTLRAPRRAPIEAAWNCREGGHQTSRREPLLSRPADVAARVWEFAYYMTVGAGWSAALLLAIHVTRLVWEVISLS